MTEVLTDRLTDQSREIIEKARDIDIRYKSDIEKVSAAALDLLTDSGGITKDKELFFLAVHGISTYGNTSEDGRKIIRAYYDVEKFATNSVNSAIAKIKTMYDDPNQTYIEELMFVPHIQSPCNDKPEIRYRLRSDAMCPAGWLELGVSGHKFFSPREVTGRTTDIAFRPLAYVEGGHSYEGKVDDFTHEFTVGFQSIYDQRPSNVHRRETHDIFVGIIDSAIEAYPNNIR